MEDEGLGNDKGKKSTSFGQQGRVNINEEQDLGNESTGHDEIDNDVAIDEDPDYEFQYHEEVSFHSKDSEASQGKRRKSKSIYFDSTSDNLHLQIDMIFANSNQFKDALLRHFIQSQRNYRLTKINTLRMKVVCKDDKYH